jgi:hypothetical protein
VLCEFDVLAVLLRECIRDDDVLGKCERCNAVLRKPRESILKTSEGAAECENEVFRSAERNDSEKLAFD